MKCFNFLLGALLFAILFTTALRQYHLTSINNTNTVENIFTYQEVTQNVPTTSFPHTTGYTKDAESKIEGENGSRSKKPMNNDKNTTIAAGTADEVHTTGVTQSPQNTTRKLANTESESDMEGVKVMLTACTEKLAVIEKSQAECNNNTVQFEDKVHTLKNEIIKIQDERVVFEKNSKIACDSELAKLKNEKKTLEDVSNENKRAYEKLKLDYESCNRTVIEYLGANTVLEDKTTTLGRKLNECEQTVEDLQKNNALLRNSADMLDTKQNNCTETLDQYKRMNLDLEQSYNEINEKVANITAIFDKQNADCKTQSDKIDDLEQKLKLRYDELSKQNLYHKAEIEKVKSCENKVGECKITLQQLQINCLNQLEEAELKLTMSKNAFKQLETEKAEEIAIAESIRKQLEEEKTKVMNLRAELKKLENLDLIQNKSQNKSIACEEVKPKFGDLVEIHNRTEKDLEEKEAKVAELTTSLDSQNTKVNELNKKLEEQKTVVAQTKNELNAERERLASLNTQNNILSSDYERLLELKEGLELEKKFNHQKMKKYDDQVILQKELEAKVSELNLELASKNGLINACNENLRQSKKQLENAKPHATKLDAESRHFEKKLNEETVRYNATINALNKELTTLNNAKDDCISAKAQIKVEKNALMQNQTALLSEVERMMGLKEETNKELYNLNLEKTAIQLERDRIANELATAKRELSNRINRNKVLINQSNINEMHHKNAIRGKNTQIEDLNTRIEYLETANENCTSSQRDIQAKMDHINNSKLNIENQRNICEKEKGRIQKEKDDNGQELKRITDSYTNIIKQVDVLQRELLQKNTAIKDIDIQRNNLHVKIRDLQKQAQNTTQLQEELDALKKEMVTNDLERQKLLETNNKLDNEKLDLTNKVEIYESNLTACKTQLHSEKKNAGENLTKEISKQNEIKSHLRDCNASIKVLQNNIVANSAELEKLKNDKESLQKRLSEAGQAEVEHKMQIKGLNDRIESMSNEASQSLADIADAKEAKKLLEEQLKESSKYIEKLKADSRNELKKHKTELSKIKEEVKELKLKNSHDKFEYQAEKLVLVAQERVYDKKDLKNMGYSLFLYCLYNDIDEKFDHKIGIFNEVKGHVDMNWSKYNALCKDFDEQGKKPNKHVIRGLIKKLNWINTKYIASTESSTRALNDQTIRILNGIVDHLNKNENNRWDDYFEIHGDAVIYPEAISEKYLANK